MARIEALLAARLFLAPQLAGDYLYFISNLGGKLSLYRMPTSGGVPEPLLPPDLALQNPDLVGGYSYAVFPKLDQIIVMLDNDGDENYQPMRIPLSGGFPVPAFHGALANNRSALTAQDRDAGILYFTAESRSIAENTAYRADLVAETLAPLAASSHFVGTVAYAPDHSSAVLAEGYTTGDVVLLHAAPNAAPTALYGTRLEDRQGGTIALSGFGAGHLDANGNLVVITTLFDDAGGLGLLNSQTPQTIHPVTINGLHHTGSGELDRLTHLDGDRYLVGYNIDGCSWVYAGTLDAEQRTYTVGGVICGDGDLAGGVLESGHHDHETDRFALAWSSATSPTQLWLVHADGTERKRLTNERVLGLPPEHLSSGEDAAFVSHDGLRVSARLYLPAAALGYTGARPLVYYVHGGPQGQERPDFAWFSMPLIQQLTLRGFAVFVPNARGSTGYGLAYTKRVDHDWGGQDRLDHVHAMGVLAKDPRIDTSRAAVVGRSYGGYMTLMLASRHPELWRAAVDMFGPYDLLTFIERIPPTWKPYFHLAVANPETEAGRAFLVERSPSTAIESMTCPLLVIQGRNDPRVVERESHDLVERLRSIGREVDYLVFDDEGHDVLKYANRVRCYNAIVDFFVRYLQP